MKDPPAILLVLTLVKQLRYVQEEKRVQSIRLLSIIAILLSCMGLFGMAQYSSRRNPEEALRYE